MLLNLLRYWSNFFFLNIIPLVCADGNLSSNTMELSSEEPLKDLKPWLCSVALYGITTSFLSIFLSYFITESWKLQIWSIMPISLNWKYKKTAEWASTFISLPPNRQNSTCGLTLYFIKEWVFFFFANLIKCFLSFLIPALVIILILKQNRLNNFKHTSNISELQLTVFAV